MADAVGAGGPGLKAKLQAVRKVHLHAVGRVVHQAGKVGEATSGRHGVAAARFEAEVVGLVEDEDLEVGSVEVAHLKDDLGQGHRDGGARFADFIAHGGYVVFRPRVADVVFHLHRGHADALVIGTDEHCAAGLVKGRHLTKQVVLDAVGGDGVAEQACGRQPPSREHLGGPAGDLRCRRRRPTHNDESGDKRGRATAQGGRQG